MASKRRPNYKEDDMQAGYPFGDFGQMNRTNQYFVTGGSSEGYRTKSTKRRPGAGRSMLENDWLW